MNNLMALLDTTLDGQSGYISSKSISFMGKLNFSFHEIHGIQCTTVLSDSNIHIVNKIDELLCKYRDSCDLSYDQRDKIINTIIPLIRNEQVLVCMLPTSDINNVTMGYNSKGDIDKVSLKYKDESCIVIYLTK